MADSEGLFPTEEEDDDVTPMTALDGATEEDVPARKRSNTFFFFFFKSKGSDVVRGGGTGVKVEGEGGVAAPPITRLEVVEVVIGEDAVPLPSVTAVRGEGRAKDGVAALATVIPPLRGRGKGEENGAE